MSKETTHRRNNSMISMPAANGGVFGGLSMVHQRD